MLGPKGGTIMVEISGSKVGVGGNWGQSSFRKNYFLFYIYLFIFRERVRDEEREGDKHQCEREKSTSCLSYMTQLGTEPATQTCVSMRNPTDDFSLCGTTPKHLSHTGQGRNRYFQSHLLGNGCRVDSMFHPNLETFLSKYKLQLCILFQLFQANVDTHSRNISHYCFFWDLQNTPQYVFVLPFDRQGNCVSDRNVMACQRIHRAGIWIQAFQLQVQINFHHRTEPPLRELAVPRKT